MMGKHYLPASYWKHILNNSPTLIKGQCGEGKKEEEWDGWGQHKKGEWRKCLKCENIFWVFQKDLNSKKYCSRQCHYSSRNSWNREGNPNWRGGKTIIAGRTALYLPEHHRATREGYVYEHLIIAEKALGRPLKYVGHSHSDNEVVHHIDENKSNNANTNLLICTSKYHKSLHRRVSNDCRHIA